MQAVSYNDQALVPEPFKKTLESRALLDHYQQSQIRKLYDDRFKLDQKIREMQQIKQNRERQIIDIQRSKQLKNEKKNEYSREYELMIQQKKEREMQDRQAQIQQEQQMLRDRSWLRGPSEQRQIEKNKQQQYGRELQQHLRMQEDRRLEEAAKIREVRERLRQEAEEASQMEQMKHNRRYQRRSVVLNGLNDKGGVKGALSWSVNSDRAPQNHEEREQPEDNQLISPKMDHMIKVKQQKYYDRGLEVQYKSQNEKRYFESQNPQKLDALLPAATENYNPISNPIPYKYKNPNVLKLLSRYS